MSGDKDTYLYAWNKRLNCWAPVCISDDQRLLVTAEIPRPRFRDQLRLVNTDDQIEQNEFGASVGVRLSEVQHIGFIRRLTLRSKLLGSGAVIAEAGRLYVFRENPFIAAGTAALTVVNADRCIGYIVVGSSDWESMTNSAMAMVESQFPYETDDNGWLWVAYRHQGATTINSAAGDDEQIAGDLVFQRVE